jgi:hypothetical protein
MNSPNTALETIKPAMGKGNFKATPLEFDLNGATHTYAGRGRWSVQLATVVVSGGKAPEKNADGVWVWRTATTSELGAATKLVNKIAEKLRAKAEKTAAQVAGRVANVGNAPCPVTTNVAVDATV